MEYQNTLQGLKNVYERCTNLGDDILQLVEMETNPEIKAMITELSNQAYSLAMDAKDNAEAYTDLKDEEVKNIDNVDDTDISQSSEEEENLELNT